MTGRKLSRRIWCYTFPIINVQCVIHSFASVLISRLLLSVCLFILCRPSIGLQPFAQQCITRQRIFHHYISQNLVNIISLIFCQYCLLNNRIELICFFVFRRSQRSQRNILIHASVRTLIPRTIAKLAIVNIDNTYF